METEESIPNSRLRPRDVRVEVAAATHIGHRCTNADAFLLDQAAGLYAVADGRGDLAISQLVARAVLDAVHELFSEPWAVLPPPERHAGEARDRLQMGLEHAHVRLLLPWRDERRRIGATFAGIVACGDSLAVGHSGDCRVYLLQAARGRLVQLTEDHTVAGQACRRGVPAKEATRLPGADKVTQMVGATRLFEPVPFTRRWERDDVAIVCTDGVSDQLDVDALANLVLEAADLGNAAQGIVDRAIGAGGCDNATVVLVHRAT